MGKVRGELEDLSFRYVDPFTYDQVHEAVEDGAARASSFLPAWKLCWREKLS